MTEQPTQIAGETPVMDPSATRLPDDLEDLIATVKEDLANRLAVSSEEVTLVETLEVEWSDSSLDCPQPDMAYLQVVTPGYRILLDVNSQIYEYHTNRASYFVFCDHPIPPFPAKP